MVEKIYGKGEFWAWNESECVMEGERPKYQLLIYTILDIQCSINVCTAGAADNSDNSNSLNTCSLLRRRRCRISTAAPILRSLCHDMCGCVCECVCGYVTTIRRKSLIAITWYLTLLLSALCRNLIELKMSRVMGTGSSFRNLTPAAIYWMKLITIFRENCTYNINVHKNLEISRNINQEIK